MSWSYSGNPLSSPKDEVRFLIGDTNSAAPEIQDEEINYVLTLTYGTVTAQWPATGNYLPAARCVDSILGKYATLTDKAVGDLHISYGQRLKNFQALSTKLRSRAALAGVPVYAGGTSLSEKIALASNPDRVGTAVVVDGMSYTDANDAPGGEQADSVTSGS